jgi:uncharacterized protein
MKVTCGCEADVLLSTPVEASGGGDMSQLTSVLEGSVNALASAPDPGYLALALALAASGALVGVLAGLFGVGGGTLIVPILYETFAAFDIAEEARMPLAIGTSLAVIIPTSISSFCAHRKSGAVDMAVLRAWCVPILAGVFMGSIMARFAPAEVFKLVFVAIALVTAARLILSDKLPCLAAEMPRGGRMAGYGVTIGASSSLMGIGGGLVAGMIMSLHGRAVHQTVATCSGVGILVSLPGAVGYILAGWDKTGLPPMSLGFVSVLGVLLLMPASLATARFGAALAHKLPKAHLELALALYLLAVSARFSVSLFS